METKERGKGKGMEVRKGDYHHIGSMITWQPCFYSVGRTKVHRGDGGVCSATESG